MVIYGISSDDAHAFKPQNIKPSKSNPGRGWVMVNARKLTADAITGAMLRGKFYSSNGVFLKLCGFTRKGYTVEIDEDATLEELESPILRGKQVYDGEEGFRIEWIGKDGKVFETHADEMTSTFKAQKSHLYIRPRVVYTRNHPQGGLEEYYAWGQPQFMDKRLKKLKLRLKR